MARQGKAGFHSGEMNSQTAKVGGRHVINKQHIPLQDFTAGTGLSVANTSAVLSGAASISFDAAITKGVGIATTIVTPPNIRPRTKAEVHVYWVTASGTDTGTSVTWDLDYRAVSQAISGTTVAATNYITSGSFSNVTETHSLISGGDTASVTALQKTVLTIPREDVEADSLLILNLFRDTAESGDTAITTAEIVAVEVEYLDG